MEPADLKILTDADLINSPKQTSNFQYVPDSPASQISTTSELNSDYDSTLILASSPIQDNFHQNGLIPEQTNNSNSNANLYIHSFSSTFEASSCPNNESVHTKLLPENQQPRTPAEFVLEAIFTEFGKTAERKVSEFLRSEQQIESEFVRQLSSGADQAFDKILLSLGLVARYQPSPVIESLMSWERKVNETMETPSGKRSLREASIMATANMLKRRKMLITKFILCRALIEVIKQLKSGSLPNDLGIKLEEVVFHQLKSADPEALLRSPAYRAIVNLYAELIGWLSNIRFTSMSDRFIAELEKEPQGGRESSYELIIRGMRCLKLKIYPADALEETADFLQSCGKFFKTTRSMKIKHAYAQVFVEMLAPIAAVALAEVNIQAWIETIDSIYPKAFKMCTKLRHWDVAYPLMSILLCVSRKEFFLSKWWAFMDSCIQRFKDKGSRQMALTCITRLIWVYLNRCTESASNIYKKLETILKTIFPPGRRQINPPDTPLDDFIQTIHFICLWDSNNVMKYVSSTLIGYDDISTLDPTIENIYPERTVIAIKAYLLFLSSLERSEYRPPFPRGESGYTSDFSIVSQPNTDVLSGQVLNRIGQRDSLKKMNGILGIITTILDQSFGGMLLCDERYLNNRNTSATNAIANAAKELTYEVQQTYVHMSSLTVSYMKDKQPYFDLMRACIEAAPRCMPTGIPLQTFIEMLCRYTIHVDPNLGRASTEALIRIAKQCDALKVVSTFSRFIIKIEDRFAELLTCGFSDSNTKSDAVLLNLYVQLLHVWQSDIELHFTLDKEEDHNKYNQVWNLITETESNGIFFLCNQSPLIRKYAIEILSLSATFDKTMSLRKRTSTNSDQGYLPQNQQPQIHIIDILEQEGNNIVKTYGRGSKLSSALQVTEQVRKQRQRESTTSILISIASKSEPEDLAAWARCFPVLIKICYDKCPIIVALTQNIICSRLLSMQSLVIHTAETYSKPANVTNSGRPSLPSLPNRWASKVVRVNDKYIEQWKIYLVFTCLTIAMADDYTQINTIVRRKRSAFASIEKISSARDLFRMVLPFLSSDQTSIRDAVVTALGHINSNAYRVLIEDLEQFAKSVFEDPKSKNSQKPSQNKRNKRNDRLRTEIAHVYQSTSHYLQDNNHLHDEFVMDAIVGFVKECKSFLYDPEVQTDWEFQKLRKYFCGLVEKVYNSIILLSESTRYISFELRISLFKMLEDWCGHGQFGSSTRDREARMMLTVLDQYKDIRERGAMTTIMEEERKGLESAALKAMAALCKGPITTTVGRSRSKKGVASFDVVALFRWMNSVFNSPDGGVHHIAKSALESLLVHNQKHPLLLEDVVHECYIGNPNLKSTQGCFSVLADVLAQTENYPYYPYKIICLALFKIADPNVEIRLHAIKLLCSVETRFTLVRCARDFENTIESHLPTIYKQAQAALSGKLARDHPELTYELLSELVMRFESVNANVKRDTLLLLIPWIRNVTLEFFTDGSISGLSIMVLTNLFYITIKHGDVYFKEIETIWAELVVGSNTQNMKVILTYLLDLGLEKRNPGFVVHAKKIIIFIGRTPAATNMINEFVATIVPETLIPHIISSPNHQTRQKSSYLFVANIDDVLVLYPKRPAFSKGQLAIILLTDLAIEAEGLLKPHLPILLHAASVHLNHFITLVSEQTRQLMINLIHSIIIDKSNNQATVDKAGSFCQKLKISPLQERQELNPVDISEVVNELVDILIDEDLQIRQKWGMISLNWATCCPVRNIACISFQIFRHLMPSMDMTMLADILARLSNTISDTSDEIQSFCLEILYTLRKIVDDVEVYTSPLFPHIFWAAMACLCTINEDEYSEALGMFDQMIEYIGEDNGSWMLSLEDSFPEEWDGQFPGFQTLLLKGLVSSKVQPRALSLINRLVTFEDCWLIDPSEGRMLFAILANLPIIMDALDQHVNNPYLDITDLLATKANACGLDNIGRVLLMYGRKRYRAKEDYLRQLFSALKDTYFPKYASDAMKFLLELLPNQNDSIKRNTLKILKVAFPYVDFLDPVGCAEEDSFVLLAPLLRLLQTEFAEDAFAVLEEAMNTSTTSNFTKNNQSNREHTTEHIIPSLPFTSNGQERFTFAVDHASGWWIRYPSHTAKLPRANVMAVVHGCALECVDKVPYFSHFQFSIQDHSTNFTTSSTQLENSESSVANQNSMEEEVIGDEEYERQYQAMIETLDELDVFFEQEIHKHDDEI
ncbi:Cell morphogenesis protein PAG1 [Basidiobolus ranarum]|uniref:Cell morphogenesis protein PAG1 n=1 Tax=Basidiobolus ranarum TaxID=34480 RepID=A0ABR2WYN5_9FUNG